MKQFNADYYKNNYSFHENESFNSFSIYRILYNMYRDQIELLENMNKIELIDEPTTYDMGKS